MPWNVTPSDVAARWRPLSAEETAVSEVLLGDAQAQLDRKRPRLAAQVLLQPTDPEYVPERSVIALLAEVVQRVLRNPDVQTSVQVSSDGSVGQSFPTTVALARPRLEVTEADLATLDPAPVTSQAVASGSGAYSVPLDY